MKRLRRLTKPDDAGNIPMLSEEQKLTKTMERGVEITEVKDIDVLLEHFLCGS